MRRPLEILLVEDNEGDVDMTERAISDGACACHLSVANNGSEAMDFLLKRGDFASAPTPQINMPRMDGKKFLEVVKQESQLKVIPVIMLTSSTSPKDIRECYERQASCYVVKPFDGMEFMHEVRQIVSFWSKCSFHIPNDFEAPLRREEQ
jgi:CheY-like chemotaxis protein